MEINSSFKDLLRLLNEGGVRYLVVGGYAVMKYTEPYNTKDLDIWIDPSPENAARTLEALRLFGTPAKNVGVKDLLHPDLIYQIGVEPVRVDVMSSVAGLSFPDSWERRSSASFDEVSAPILSLDDVIAAKRAAARPQDRLQARQLEKAKSLAAKRRKRS